MSNPAVYGWRDNSDPLPPINTHVIDVELTDEQKDAAQGLSGSLYGIVKMGGIGSRSKWARLAKGFREDGSPIATNKTGVVCDLAREAPSIVWCKYNAEQNALAKLLPDCADVTGATKEEDRVERIDGFKSGDLNPLLTKPEILGFGLNLQCARRHVFSTIQDSYEDYYQAVKRSNRTGSKHPLDVFIPITDLERPCSKRCSRRPIASRPTRRSKSNCLRRWAVSISEPILSAESPFHVHHGDAIEHMASLPDAAFDMSVFSPPFPSVYAYTDSDRDIGNSEDLKGDAKLHLSFFFRQFARLLKPGRVAMVHVQQIPRMKRSGGRGLNDFRGLCIRLGERAGLTYEYDWLIRKNPQAQAIRGKAWELKFQGVETDRSMTRGTLCDYLIKFRARARTPSPSTPRTRSPATTGFSGPRAAWFDIRETDTLNGQKGLKAARSDEDTKHICPLQLQVIDRLVRLYSNPGEVVFSPFAGIGSELVTALKLGRLAYGCELKAEYHREAVKNCESVTAAKSEQGSLSDMLDEVPA